VRRPPAEGFSWIDRRFLRDHAPHLGRDAILLYFFLAAVADKQGLSFYGDASIASRLRLEPRVVLLARDELVARELVAYEAPLAQILSLPEPRHEPRTCARPRSLGEILRDAMQHPAEGDA
jgi:hypothetical protein